MFRSHLLGQLLLALTLLIPAISANPNEISNVINRDYIDDDELGGARRHAFRYLDYYDEPSGTRPWDVSGSGDGAGGDDEDGYANSGSGGTDTIPNGEICGPDTDVQIFCNDPCGKAFCKDYLEAECRVSDCETCEVEWYVHGRKITQSDCTNRPPICPGVWIPKGDHCYRVQNRYALTHKDAEKYCMKQGGFLLQIVNRDEESTIQTLPLTVDMTYWTTPGSRYWNNVDDKWEFTYMMRIPGEPNVSGGVDDRVALTEKETYWQWNIVNQYYKFYPICEAAPDKVLSHCHSSPCMNGGHCVMVTEDTYRCDCGDTYTGTYCELSNDNSHWHRFQGHMYLVVSDFGLTYPEAMSYCGVHDAYLLSLNTEPEWEFIKGILDKKGLSAPVNTIYTGGYKTPSVSWSAVAWTDGSVLGSFADWGPYEPKLNSARYIQLKFYPKSTGYLTGWRWADTYGNYASSFICEKNMYGTVRRQLSYKSGIVKRLYKHKWNHIDATRQY